MGGSESKHGGYKSAISDLITNQQSYLPVRQTPIESPITLITDLVTQQAVASLDDSFWERYWSDTGLTTKDFFQQITPKDMHNLMEKASGNLTTLCFKVVARISAAVGTACAGPNEHTIVLNCVRLLTRLIPFLFESPDWRLLFWTPANILENMDQGPPPALAQVLLNALTDLLFCPDFTVLPKSQSGPEKPEDLSSIESCDYIWEAGIGCAHSPGTTPQLDNNRTEILRLLITCFSESMYLSPDEVRNHPNRWLAHFTSQGNRHVLPLLTSLLNVICSYDPIGYGVPYYYALVRDQREDLTEVCAQLLSILLDYYPPGPTAPPPTTHASLPEEGATPAGAVQQESGLMNLFAAYISRLHQNEDLEFLLKGLAALLCNPLKQSQTYLPQSVKRIYFTEVLYILIWKSVSYNQKFLAYILRSPLLFDILVPLLYELLRTRNNPNMVGMLHVGVFILLMLSGERNFGVRLNKPFNVRLAMDIPKFTGTHADLLFLVFHKIITSGLSRIQPLYDCLLTVLVNVSPYLKSLSMVTCTRLMHLLESFSTTWYLFAKPANHYLVFYLLEALNNIIQYQFDGNTNLVYAIVRSKDVFYQLANIPEDVGGTPIQKPSVQLPRLLGNDKSKEESEGSNEGADSAAVEQTATAAAMPEIIPMQSVPIETVEVDMETEGASPPASPQVTETSLGSALAAEGNSSSTSIPSFSSSYDPPKIKRPGKSPPAGLPPGQLLPLRKQIAKGNRQLQEPSSPSDFKPSSEWIKSWKQKLPLHTVLRLLQVLVPQVERLCLENDVKSESEVLEYLKNGTLVGLLPVPHPIIIRKYQPSDSTEVWFHTYIWGVIYVRNYDPPVWYDTTINLFLVNKINAS